MAHYKGAASEGTRAMNLMKKREKQREELERLKQKISEDHAVKSKFETIDKYSTHYDAVEEQLKSSTIGLVTLEEMKEKRETLVREREKQIAANAAAAEIERERKRKRKQVAAGTLSFNMDEDEEEEEEEEGEGEGEVGKREDEGGQRNGKENENLRSLEGPVTIKKIRKNPEVDTSFLPDRDREEAERKEREKLRQEWVQKQETIKNEEIHITYSYWDGSGHRRQIKMKKGETIRQFLQKCLENLRKEFTELRATSVDNLMYIKEDLIIPQHHSFYDFIVNKARGKSGQ